MTDHADERRAIEHATIELLQRDNTQTRPTVTELCALTGLPRWKLTHRHIDLKESFLNEVTMKWGSRSELSPQARELARLRKQAADLRAELEVSQATVRLYAEALEEVRLQLADAREQSGGRALPRIPRADE